MMTVYQRQGQHIVARNLEPGEAIPDDVLWIDLHTPTPEVLQAVEQQLGIQIPSRHEVWKNHVLNRQYVEQGVAYMTAAIITKVGSPYPETSAVTFILAPKFLLTVRDIAPTSFRNFAQRLQHTGDFFQTSAHVLEGLMEEIITRVAHNSEIVVETLAQLSHSIFGADVLEKKDKNPSQLMRNVLKRMGTCADLNSTINESLHSISRLLSFFRQIIPVDAEVESNINVLMADAMALIQQTAFLSDKITFQLDAALGMINVEQNLIIKILSVVTVFFLPPTLVASLYGMNFKYMPELNWVEGYPMAVMLMSFCALLPYFYFRRKGWL